MFLTNHPEARPRNLIMNYARRNRIEDSLGTSVNFFHLDCLSSEVRLNVDLDVTMTVIANGCYSWLARRLKGFDKAKPKQLYRKFVETGGVIEVVADRTLRVTFDRRSHNPILCEAALDRDCPPIHGSTGTASPSATDDRGMHAVGTGKMSVDFPPWKSAVRGNPPTPSPENRSRNRRDTRRQYLRVTAGGYRSASFPVTFGPCVDSRLEAPSLA